MHRNTEFKKLAEKKEVISELTRASFLARIFSVKYSSKRHVDVQIGNSLFARICQLRQPIPVVIPEQFEHVDFSQTLEQILWISIRVLHTADQTASPNARLEGALVQLF